MERIIKKIFFKELQENISLIQEINGLGSVNKIFSVKTSEEEYIIRLNESPSKRIEYKKENFCLNEVLTLGVPTPKVLKFGFHNDISFMILEKINGINGSLCNDEEKEIIWKKLGLYASKYHNIKRIKNKEVEESEFHENWQARLEYNIKELHKNDSLLLNTTLDSKEQNNIIKALSNLRQREFRIGLIHGDLASRNVIRSNENVYLLDWGTAEINVVPHIEIGILLMSKEVNKKEFQFFLEGLGISNSDYLIIEPDIRLLNLLHRLDKYRWAETYDLEKIEDYALKIKEAFNHLI